MLYAVSECEVSGEGPIQSPPVCKRCESDVTRKPGRCEARRTRGAGWVMSV